MRICEKREALAVVRFVHWLYDTGIDPDAMPRSKLIEKYGEYLRDEKAKREPIDLDRERVRRGKGAPEPNPAG